LLVVGCSVLGDALLKRITLLRERVEDWSSYPFSVPAIRELDEIQIHSRVVFFAGENGTGKSTLLEAIAGHYGFGPEGGNRNLQHDTTEHNHSTEALIRALRLSFDIRTGKGFFLRAESFFNTATQLDELDKVGIGPPILPSYGGISLHQRSHGETFFTLLTHKFRRNGLFLLDEPEAALSPQRQLAFLVLMHDTLRRYKDSQFIISTHSPVLLAYPKAQILSFDSGKLREIGYEETAPLQIVRQFVNHPDEFLDELFQEPGNLFGEE
jgi:predicted ATPase